MTGLPTELVLGGRRAVWVWGTTDDPFGADEPRTGAIPAAVLVDHGNHTLLVPWATLDSAPDAIRPFTLEALIPLTITEPVTCAFPDCGMAGRIVAGEWLAAADA